MVTIHDLIHLENASELKKVYFRQIVRRGLLSAGAIITVSEWTKKELSSFLGPKTFPEITVIGNSLEESWLKGDAARSKGVEDLEILAVSNPKPHKNLVTLLKAMNLLWLKGHRSRLNLVIGAAELPPHLKQVLDPIVQDRVRLKWGMSEDELRAEYQRAHLLVSPSQFEGYNFPIAEALSQGTAVVASKTSANVEFSSGDVRFFEPFDNVDALAGQIEKTTTSLKATCKLPENVLSLTKMAERTLGVYQKAIS